MCPNRIEQTRAQRGGETCSQVCKDAYRQWRLERRREQVCPSCLHPSTPAEWESWRKWRLDNDGVANPTDPRRGNPHWEARARQFRKTLESAAKVADTILEDFRFKLGEGQILEPQSQATMGMLEELLSDVKGKLDDPLPQSTAPKQIRQPRLEEVPCPVCHAPNQFDLDSPPATVIKCATCGQKIADPRVTRSKKFPPLP
jgi:ribosomal protein S27E